jgi:CBS domain-containing protein
MDVERVVEILCRYRHQVLGEDEIEIIPDLQLVNVFAARVQGRIEYLVRTDEGRVEEVDFDGWPPMQAEPSDAGAVGDRAPSRAEPRVERLMSRPVYLCDADATLADAARLMWERDCGALPVSRADEDGADRLVGMLTDRDLCMAALFAGRPLSALRVADVMSRPIESVAPGDPVSLAARLMHDAQIRRLPVVDSEGRLAGFLSLADVALASQEERFVDPRLAGDALEGICRPRIGS